MNRKRFLAVVIVLCALCLPLLSACEGTQEEWLGEGGRITVGKQDELILQINPDRDLVKKSKGETVLIYEYKLWQTDGEPIAAPIAEVKLEKHMEIAIPLADEGGISRLYSSFTAVLASGESLFPAPVCLESPELLAKDGESIDRLCNMIPDAINQITSFVKKDKKEGEAQ